MYTVLTRPFLCIATAALVACAAPPAPALPPTALAVAPTQTLRPTAPPLPTPALPTRAPTLPVSTPTMVPTIATAAQPDAAADPYQGSPTQWGVEYRDLALEARLLAAFRCARAQQNLPPLERDVTRERERILRPTLPTELADLGDGNVRTISVVLDNDADVGPCAVGAFDATWFVDTTTPLSRVALVAVTDPEPYAGSVVSRVFLSLD